ncbi:hypothetical protein [uncultured Rikenella sp.]|uniref:hypothetical protein n=1 Tax=uncultured Rikenella sp. TaxID=368003 RepID=UPI002625CE91|nr:hypothetical protein [uncultured Rikenella sp.]
MIFAEAVENKSTGGKAVTHNDREIHFLDQFSDEFLILLAGTRNFQITIQHVRFRRAADEKDRA